MAPDDPKIWLWLISFAVFVPPTRAELPMSLKNLAVDNVIIAECSDPGRLRMFEGKQHCSFEPGGRTVCFRGLDTRRTLHSQGRFNRTKELILCDWPTQRFDPRELAELVPNVEKFAITGERIWMLKYDFPPLMNLWAINITGTKLNQTRASSFQRLPALRQLNMRGNALVEIVPFVFRSAHVDIYLQ
ncbi:hypothetical protein pipiens_016917, partial [Culex pipiens pipiens]